MRSPRTWPTTWPPSPCPWTTGSPRGSCSTSSPWGPKRGSAVIQPSSPYCVQLYSRSCVVFLHHICQIYQITVVSHSVHILTYCRIFSHGLTNYAEITPFYNERDVVNYGVSARNQTSSRQTRRSLSFVFTQPLPFNCEELLLLY